MIIKVKQTSEFAQIKNVTLRDKRLDLDTRGALGEILTYSENFEADVPGLMALFDIKRERLLKITNQLKENGYLEIKPVHDKRGRIVDKEWIFYGVSQNFNFRKKENKPENHDTEKPDNGENHDTEKPNVGQNHTTEKPDDLFKQESLEEKYEDKDLKTRTQNTPARANGSNGSSGNGFPQNKTATPSAELSPGEILPKKDEYAEKIFHFLEVKRMDTPFEYPKWVTAIDFAYKRSFSVEDFTGTINYLQTDPEQKRFRKGRITAEIVTNNLQVYFDLKKQQQTDSAPPPTGDTSKCSDCDVRGLKEVLIDGEKRMFKCSHPGLKKAA